MQEYNINIMIININYHLSELKRIGEVEKLMIKKMFSVGHRKMYGFTKFTIIRAFGDDIKNVVMKRDMINNEGPVIVT